MAAYAKTDEGFEKDLEYIKKLRNKGIYNETAKIYSPQDCRDEIGKKLESIDMQVKIVKRQ